MYLLINNSWPDQAIFQGVYNDFCVERFIPRTPSGLLGAISVFLKEFDLSVQDIAGIVVVVGKGHFTGTRIAVTIANIFAYARQIPILSVKEYDNYTWLEALKKATPGQYISAEYSTEPRVGKK